MNGRTYVGLLNQLPQNGKNLFRKIESSNNKLVKLRWSKTFNEVYLKKDILPNYTKTSIIKNFNKIQYQIL